MKHKLGLALITAGAVMIGAALLLLLYNQREQTQAEESVRQVIPQVVEAIHERQEEKKQEAATSPTAPPIIQEEPDPLREMPVSLIDGHFYIGFVSIPSLQLELPVMADWTYDKLKIAPCRYTGTVYADNLVIMAHNYARHFGNLDELRMGDTVTFTDMDGITVEYAVEALDILQPTAIAEMTAGDYDLTLFTCTYGGKSRVTLRCNRVEP